MHKLKLPSIGRGTQLLNIVGDAEAAADAEFDELRSTLHPGVRVLTLVPTTAVQVRVLVCER